MLPRNLRSGNLPPGLHILIVQAGNFGGAPNRFAVSANGRPLVAAQSVAKGISGTVAVTASTVLTVRMMTAQPM